MERASRVLHVNSAWFFPVLVFLGMYLAGCQGIPGVKGPVPEVDRIPLVQGQSTDGTWQGRDLSITYRYLRNGNNLDINGRVDLAGHITNNFEQINYVHVQAYFLDGAGNVIGSSGLMNSGWSSRLVGGYSYPFHTTLTLPPGTAALALSYTGRAISPGGREEGGMPYDFFGGP